MLWGFGPATHRARAVSAASERVTMAVMSRLASKPTGTVNKQETAAAVVIGLHDLESSTEETRAAALRVDREVRTVRHCRVFDVGSGSPWNSARD